MFKTQIITLALSVPILLMGCGKADSPNVNSAPSGNVEVSSEQADTALIAVLSYADWCGSCKVLDPVIKSVQPGLEAKGVEFVVLDYTNKDDTAYFAQADAAGVGDAIRGAMTEKVKTGKLMLVKPGGNVVIDNITKADGPDEIKAKVSAALAS